MSGFLPIAVFAAAAIFCIALAIVFKIQDRHSLLGETEPDFIEKGIEKKKRKLNANLGTMSFKTYCTLLIGLPIVCGLCGWLILKDITFAVLLAVFSAFLPDIAMQISARKQKDLFEQRYARALKALSSCLRANMSIQQAITDVSNNIFVHESIRNGFRQMKADIAVGMTIQQAFRRFADDTGSSDAQDVASAIAMQVEVGGSEAAVLENVSNNIQNRIMMRREIKTLFAEINVLMIAMDIVPIAVLLLFYFGMPMMVQPYFESLGMTLVLIGILVFTFVGSFVIRKQLRNAQRGEKRK